MCMFCRVRRRDNAHVASHAMALGHCNWSNPDPDVEYVGERKRSPEPDGPPPKRRRLDNTSPAPVPAYELFWTGSRRPAATLQPPTPPTPPAAAAAAAAAAVSYPTPRSMASKSPSPSLPSPVLPSSNLPSLYHGSHFGQAPPTPPSTTSGSSLKTEVDDMEVDETAVRPEPLDLPPGAPSRGHGLRATRVIQKGTVVVSERPFIRVMYPIDDKAVRDAFDLLDDTNRIEFLSFTSVAKEGEEELVFQDVFDTNSLPCTAFDVHDELILREGDRARDSYPAGIFKTISRVNHSCAPNSEYRWDEGKQECVLYALDLIDDGEEITTSYLSVLRREVLLPHVERRALIKTRLGFECQCRVCARSPEEIEATDMAYTQIRQRLQRWDKMSWPDYVSNSATEVQTVLNMLKGLQQWAFVTDACDALFYTHAVRGREAEAQAAAQMGLAELEAKLGSGEARRWPVAQWAKDPTTFEDWDLANLEPPSSGENRVDDDGEWEGSSNDWDSDWDDDERERRRAIRKRPRAKERADKKRRERYERRSGRSVQLAVSVN